MSKAPIAIVGLGYVGLPLAASFINCGRRVIGYDVDTARVDELARGVSRVEAVPGSLVASWITNGLFWPSTEPKAIEPAEAVLVTVPTPLTAQGEPDLSAVEAATRAVAPVMKPGALFVLESTTWPGTTYEVVHPILCELNPRGFGLAYSPEREDPGNPNWPMWLIPKVVGADSPAELERACELYREAFQKVVPVSSTRAAEAVKLTENVYRATNIALVNELKMCLAPLGVDVFEVIRAAATKPFGFSPFWPGPGVGGHCIPVDPLYLAWKVRERGRRARFVELAWEVNRSMPRYVFERVTAALNARGLPVKGAEVILLGVAYKPNVADTREAPAHDVAELLEAAGARVAFLDPHVEAFRGLERLDAEAAAIALEGGAVGLLLTDHDATSLPELVRFARLVVDTRGAVDPTWLAGRLTDAGGLSRLELA